MHIQTLELCRYYHRGSQVVRAVDGADLVVTRGEFVAVVGSSGSGKSTLLNLLAGLDTPTSGSIEVDGRLLTALSRSELSAYRAHQVGMIFQSFNLLPHRTALQNVELALFFNSTPHAERRKRATDLLARLGMQDRLDHHPMDLSGGEQQRVAIARALVKRPDILLADEPTGNLDRENSQLIVDMLSELHRDGLTVLMVTHDLDLASAKASRLVKMDYGQIVDDSRSAGGSEQ